MEVFVKIFFCDTDSSFERAVVDGGGSVLFSLNPLVSFIQPQTTVFGRETMEI